MRSNCQCRSDFRSFGLESKKEIEGNEISFRRIDRDKRECQVMSENDDRSSRGCFQKRKCLKGQVRSAEDSSLAH